MAKSSKNPKVDWYFVKEEKWHHEIEKLRTIALACGLNEELKWGCPCYTLDGNNIVLIHVFKGYCAYLFFKGVLLQDPHAILIQQTKDVQVPRQIRFTSVEQIVKMESILKDYIKDAIEVEKKGLKVELKKTSEYSVPDEFQQRLDDVPALKTAFEALTPGRQRGYLYYLSQPKTSKTREARVEKAIPKIFEGKGWDE